MMHNQVIALFVKPPIPGRVKTRLARDIGDQAACSIYCKLAEHTIYQIQTSGLPLALFFDGNDPAVLPSAWLQTAQLCLPQQGNNLGDRMVAAFRHLIACGCKQVILIGSDIPGIDAAYLQQAFQLLVDANMVLGPTLDGGYCLIGFNSDYFTESVFQEIPWSSDQVCKQTLDIATALDLKVGLLKPLRDIDTLDDFKKARKQYPILLTGDPASS